jgi:thiopurine S-methyltransferase
MQPTFWHERWTLGQTAFHEGAPNRFLLRYLDRLGPPGAIFVPLCGKSFDLDALAQHGHDVTGCELVPLAVEEYFRERNVTPATHHTPTGPVYESGSLRIACGDVFAFESERAPFDAAFDRAALVALPPELRARYVAKLASLLRPGAPVLLVTMEHDLGSGPPFSVPEDAVRAACAEAFAIELLADEDVAQSNARFIERGATFVRERAYLLNRK